jgi:hypothetical protein
VIDLTIFLHPRLSIPLMPSAYNRVALIPDFSTGKLTSQKKGLDLNSILKLRRLLKDSAIVFYYVTDVSNILDAKTHYQQQPIRLDAEVRVPIMLYSCKL